MAEPSRSGSSGGSHCNTPSMRPAAGLASTKVRLVTMDLSVHVAAVCVCNWRSTQIEKNTH